MLTMSYNSGEVSTAAAIDLAKQLIRQSSCDFAIITIHRNQATRHLGVSVTLTKQKDGNILETWDALIKDTAQIEANNNKSWGVDTLSDH